MICCLRLRARGRVLYIKHSVAGVAELADARDSKSRFLRSVGSIPTAGSPTLFFKVGGDFFIHLGSC